ncbi:hypothetical protein LTR37_016720 [Vermiconidia calcicola]|uniref:Uncharacterized protein n=1 Tax=Vermiconidia calcicola TaxID=1690605 RepID=A0ACC3MM09_9PEZI|nr:hypothetical protein LTR37_016720 [Vermiconidia calcicola]
MSAKKPGPPNAAGSSPTRLRQIALVARDLEKAKEVLTKVLGTEVIYVDPKVGQWGLENTLLAVGGEVIEVVSPKQPGTTAGRLLDRRGDGGYMIIMQTEDAKKRKEYIESNGLAKVIWTHEGEDSFGAQYHPKGIRGGVMPELDSQAATKENPKPLTTRFSPWHPCGPNVKSYTSKMEEYGHLSLVGAVCRLQPGDWGSELASTQWEQIFGVPRSRDLIQFTNARVGFLHGEDGQPEGIISITIGVVGERRRQEIFRRAKEMGILDGDGSGKWVNMVGVKWYFALTSEDEWPSKL